MAGRRRARIRLSPVWLPTIRAVLAKRWRQAAENEGTEYQRVLSRGWNAADGLSTAPLWWVARDMTKLAVDTAMHDSPPPTRPPSPTGLIVFDGGLGAVTVSIPEYGLPSVSIDALYWSATDAGGGVLRVIPFTADPRVLGLAGERELPLAMVAQGRGGFFFNMLLRATFALAMEPRVCETRTAPAGRTEPVPRRYDPSLPAHRIKMLILRENLHRPGTEPEPGEDDPTRYTHRWIVRGFWRNQTYGPHNSLRRRQWIPPYVKGPADKPLIVKETVRLWRR